MQLRPLLASAGLSAVLLLSALPAQAAEGTGVYIAPSSTTVVEVQAEHVTGLRPDGSTVVFRIKVVAQGADASSLVGDGRHFGSGGSHSYWPATGSVDGTVVTLSGVVAESNNPLLFGVPVEIEADSSTGEITFVFGPLPEGPPYDGGTIVAEGVGRVRIRTIVN